jgi:hypothetical protein
MNREPLALRVSLTIKNLIPRLPCLRVRRVRPLLSTKERSTRIVTSEKVRVVARNSGRLGMSRIVIDERCMTRRVRR